MMRAMDSESRRALIDRACRSIVAADRAPDLATLAAEAGLSAGHFQRLFKAAVGLSPKRFAMAHRQQRLGNALRRAPSVTEAIYTAGYAASSGAYRDSRQLGMAPRRLAAGGRDEQIRHATARTSLGPILVAATAQGICMVEFGQQAALLEELRRRFPGAVIAATDRRLQRLVKRVVAVIDGQGTDTGLPLDIRGTAFQMRVWQALTKVKPGETLAYAELAARIGAPGSARAVARACATNGIAVLVPCHRVVASDGSLAGYKWGIQRKRRLLQQEQAANPDQLTVR